MCLPIIGAVVGAAGSIFSGMAASAQYNGQAAVYKAEAKAKQYQAQSQANSGAYESSIKLDEGKRLTGQQVTGFASSGVDVASGTPGEVIADSNSSVNMDVAAIRANWQDRANMSAYESKIAKLNAKNAKSNAKMAMVGGVVGALSPALDGFTKAGGSFG